MHGIRRKEGSTYILHFFNYFQSIAQEMYLGSSMHLPEWRAQCVPVIWIRQPCYLVHLYRNSSQKGNPLHTKQMRVVMRALVLVITLRRSVVFHCEKCPSIQ